MAQRRTVEEETARRVERAQRRDATSRNVARLQAQADREIKLQLGRSSAGAALSQRIGELQSVAGLGADCIEKEMRDEHLLELRRLLEQAELDDVSAEDFRRYGSARQLYNFNVDHLGSY